MRILLACCLALVAACARPPKRIAGEFPPIRPGEVQRGEFMGEHVRWGGVIVETEPRRDETCIEVVSLPLDRRARPRLVDDTFGRFFACVPGFYDPEIYSSQREVTVVGTIEGVERAQVGEQDYDFPRLAADAVYLWPERTYDDRVRYGVGIGFGYPWYPFYGGYYHGGYSHYPHHGRPGGPMIHRSPRGR
jgi:outer membrane lipoprotein